MIEINASYWRPKPHGRGRQHRNVTGIILDMPWDAPDSAAIRVELRKHAPKAARGHAWMVDGYCLVEEA